MDPRIEIHKSYNLNLEIKKNYYYICIRKIKYYGNSKRQ